MSRYVEANVKPYRWNNSCRQKRKSPRPLKSHPTSFIPGSSRKSLEGSSFARQVRTTWHLASSIGCNQSAVTMRFGAGLTSAKLTLFFRSSTAGWTTESKYLFRADFSFHGKKIRPQPSTRMINFEQLWQLLHQRLAATWQQRPSLLQIDPGLCEPSFGHAVAPELASLGASLRA